MNKSAQNSTKFVKTQKQKKQKNIKKQKDYDKQKSNKANKLVHNIDAFVQKKNNKTNKKPTTQKHYNQSKSVNEPTKHTANTSTTTRTSDTTIDQQELANDEINNGKDDDDDDDTNDDSTHDTISDYSSFDDNNSNNDSNSTNSIHSINDNIDHSNNQPNLIDSKPNKTAPVYSHPCLFGVFRERCKNKQHLPFLEIATQREIRAIGSFIINLSLNKNLSTVVYKYYPRHNFVFGLGRLLKASRESTWRNILTSASSNFYRNLAKLLYSEESILGDLHAPKCR